MSVTEPRRHHLYKLVSEWLDEPSAETLFDMIDAIDTDQFATKSDISELRAATKSDISELRAEMKSEFSELRAEMKSEFERFATKDDLAHLAVQIDARLQGELRTAQNRYVTWLLASQAVVVGVIALASSLMVVVLR